MMLGGQLRARLPRSTLALLVTLFAYVQAQQFTRKVVLEQPAGQTEQVLSPIYSLFGMPAETAPKLFRIQSPTVGSNVRLISPTTHKSLSTKAGSHPTATLIAESAQNPDEASPSASEEGDIVAGELIPTGFIVSEEPKVAAERIETPETAEETIATPETIETPETIDTPEVVEPRESIEAPGTVEIPEAREDAAPEEEVSAKYLSDPGSEFDPKALERSIDGLEHDIHRREETWKDLVGAAAEGRTAVEVSAAQRRADAKAEEAEERLREFRSSSEQALDDVRRAAEAQRERSERQMAYAARSAGRPHRRTSPPALLLALVSHPSFAWQLAPVPLCEYPAPLPP
jgi:hypothetical protein